VDNGRSLGSWQVDMFKSHNHQIWWMVHDNNIDGADSTTRYSFENHYQWVTSTSVWWNETRPRNVALLYCQK
jgi:hypothetical protein